MQLTNTIMHVIAQSNANASMHIDVAVENNDEYRKFEVGTM